MKIKTQKYTYRFSVGFKEEQRKKINQKARENKQTPAEWIRSLVEKEL